MTKTDLTKLLASDYPELRYRDVERVVELIFDEIANALIDGDRVELRGFGSFSVHTRSSRIGRNPRTGASVNVPATFVPRFKTGKAMRDLLNGFNLPLV